MLALILPSRLERYGSKPIRFPATLAPRPAPELTFDLDPLAGAHPRGYT